MQNEAEAAMEHALIEKLISGTSQWVRRKDLHNEDDLWQNFREKLEANNLKELDDHPLTEQEFQQIKNQLNFVNFYEAAKWLVGENGQAKVQVQREDATLGTIRLTVIRRQDIAGGSSSYEVINQFETPKRRVEDVNRRFDVTLLINGLPMIHIELKNRTHPYMDAFRQIRKYLAEGKFTGIYSTVQMFVVTNGTDTRYIASAPDTKINDQFLTKWVDRNNQPIDDYLGFADQVLSIPMAHKMVTQYTVLDQEKKALIMLRPYQIHAIEAVKEASIRQESGYIWHTTGSGKTLTSYKVARNLLQISSIDKTIFIVDRVDLDQQTSSSFNSYAENDVIDVSETDNVKDLIIKLLSDERNVIVTTIQKLNFVMKRFANKVGTKRYDKLTQLHLAFVVDECHRAVSPQKKKEISAFFTRSLWYGFTGTPIFKENAKKVDGNLARTTEQLYGARLHEYTVKEAIHDHAVLGFQVEYKSTLSEDTIDAYVEATAKKKIDIDEWTAQEKEARLSKDVYLDDQHMLQVIDSIVNKSYKKLGFDLGVGRTRQAILTTSSISQAQKYYQMFKAVQDGKSSVKVAEKFKKVLPDFPRVAMTYSISENDETSQQNQAAMKAAMKDYNKEFNTSFTMETLRGYNSNVNDRLARKKERYLSRAEQLDLVIVVDRLLTGFDAPNLSTLFIDRPPMQPHDLIQAFSRTNRLFDSKKAYGQIVTFQMPAIFEDKVKEALVLYSNGGENDVLAPEWPEAKVAFKDAIKNLFRVVESPETIDMENIPLLKKFVKAFQKLDSKFSDVQVYSEYDDDLLGTEFPIVYSVFEAFEGKYHNALEAIRHVGPDPELLDFDIDYELRSIKTDKINYEYIIMLIQTLVPQGNDAYELVPQHNKKVVDEVNKYISTLQNSNPQLAHLMSQLWHDVLQNPEDFRDKNISVLLEDMVQDAEYKIVEDFSKRWCVEEETVRFMADHFNPAIKIQQGNKELLDHADYKEYKLHSEHPVNKLKYGPALLKDFNDMMEANMIPLRKR